MNVRRTSLGIITLVLAGGLQAGCGDDDKKQPTAPPAKTVEDYISRVASIDDSVVALVRTGTPPAGPGPSVSVEGPTSVILGGSSQVDLTSAVPLAKVIVSVQGIGNYWEFNLPAVSTATTLIVTFGQAVPENSFDLLYTAANAAGAFGPPAQEPVTVRAVGTGEVQVSVSWDSASDVDLHVIDPSNEEIYYANTTSTSGGVLDLDSNPGCVIDGINNENITWASNAPQGSYSVRLDYFDECNVERTNYTVTVRVKNQAPKTFPGTFTGEGDLGAAGSGIPIATFTR